MTVADLLVRRLKEQGVRHVFGYPGGQLTPLYDALHRDGGIRHVLARDEQAAGFMADGYARATGRVGVCLAVCGPGVLNAATPLATAYTDSIPILLISGQIATRGAGLRSGFYHENDQLHACTTLTKWRAGVTLPGQIVPTIDSAFGQMRTRRPGPALVEVPLDVQVSPAPEGQLPAVEQPTPLPPSAGEIAQLARLVRGWRKP